MGAQRQAKKELWIAGGGLERKAAWEARQAEMQARKEVADDVSEASYSTASTLKPEEPAGPLRLSDFEEKEVRKYEKVLREISKIEERMTSGEKVDALQLRKVQRRSEIEATLVMQKVRLGFARAGS